jgi:hypothetical protein
MTHHFLAMLFNDPTVNLELVAVLFTLGYVARLTLSQNINQFHKPENTKHTSIRMNIARRNYSIDQQFWSLFSVGRFVSSPKRSLLKQKVA